MATAPATLIQKTEVKMKRLFLCTIQSCKYHFKNGKEANFISGEYATDAAEEIEQLDAEVAAMHPHIYIDPKRKEVDASTLDPLEVIKRKAVEEYIAAQAAATDTSRDMGNTSAADILAERLQGIATSANVAGAAAQSTGK